MRMYDIIQKKKQSKELSLEEIQFFINGFVSGQIPDYQASALMMAIWFNSMSDEEITNLTLSMMNSGETIDLSEVNGFTVDKHSTGGVGDKTTLIVAPIVAACGGKVAKMSGRGLGHTGGTIDKLESIEGFNTSLKKDDFIKNVNKHGLCVIGQTGNLAPADKKLYALRDVTATVDSVALIASSIMSKKLAAGSQGIVLDVKTGSGAFMKTQKDSELLAEKMIKIGNAAGKKTVALITNMDVPLGSAIGNSLEVKEAIMVLSGKQKGDLYEVCIELAANMLSLVHSKSVQECKKMAIESVEHLSALNKLKEMVAAQGGNPEWIDDPQKFPQSKICFEIKAEQGGYLNSIDALKVGEASVILGAGRENKEDTIDHKAGIILNKKICEMVNEGDSLAYFYTDDESLIPQAQKLFQSAVSFCDEKPEPRAVILKTIK